LICRWRRNHYQPLSMALSTFSFQSLNSNRLIFQTSLEAIINETFVDFPETSFTEEIILWEALCDRFELFVGEYVNVYEERVWEVVEWDGWIAEIGHVDSAWNRGLSGEKKKFFLWWVCCCSLLLVCVIDAAYGKTYILPRKSHWFHLKLKESLCVCFLSQDFVYIWLMVFILFFWMNEHIEIIYGNFFEKRVSEKLERERKREVIDWWRLQKVSLQSYKAIKDGICH